MKNQVAEAHARGASREVTTLFAHLDAMFPFEPLDEAANILNLACEANGLPGVYSAKYLLSQALNAQLRLSVILPADFIVHRENDKDPFADSPRRPVFPAQSDFLCIEPHTAYEIFQSQGGTVALRRAANIKPDGTTDTFVAARPYANISLADLRMDQDEIIRLIREFPNATRDHTSDLGSSSVPPKLEISESFASATVANARHAASIDVEATDSALHRTRHTIKCRRNLLDPVIDMAITEAKSNELHAVFLCLRNMAINEEGPFNGDVKGGALSYTDVNGNVAALTKDALAARLRRRKASISDGSGR